MEKLLPNWIIGAPFVCLVVDWIIAPKSRSTPRTPRSIRQWPSGRFKALTPCFRPQSV